MPHLNRRQLLQQAGAVAAAAALAPLSALAQPASPSGPFKLPPLPYDYDALEPHIDKTTMQIHHDKHHKAYVDNLNKAVAGHEDLEGKNLKALLVLAGQKKLPEAINQIVINNGGGHANHTMFWQIMAAGEQGGGEPKGNLADAIKSTFGDLERFKKAFSEAAMKRFGSGWAWLILSREGKPKILSTANQDSPHMNETMPLLGIDVWEHAYYLKYQNRRADYIKAWWNVVNWKEVSDRFDKARA